MKNVLVVHGPNLNLLGERPGDDPALTLDVLNHRLQERANTLGLQLRVFQSNHEGELIDRLQAERRWAEGIILSPDVLAHTSYALREAVAAVARPTIEVHLTDIRRRESWRRRSVIKDVCQGQQVGKGVDSYLLALEQLARGSPAARGRKRPPAKAQLPIAAPPAKSVGRRAEKSIGRKNEVAASASDFLTRALVRRKIAERLSGRLTPVALAAWARTQWNKVQEGAPAEAGQRDTLEDALQTLTLSNLAASRLSDEQLVDLMAQLEG